MLFPPIKETRSEFFKRIIRQSEVDIPSERHFSKAQKKAKRAREKEIEKEIRSEENWKKCLAYKKKRDARMKKRRENADREFKLHN